MYKASRQSIDMAAHENLNTPQFTASQVGVLNGARNHLSLMHQAEKVAHTALEELIEISVKIIEIAPVFPQSSTRLHFFSGTILMALIKI